MKVLKKLTKEGLDALDQGQGLVVRDEGALKKAISKIGQLVAKTPLGVVCTSNADHSAFSCCPAGYRIDTAMMQLT